MMLSTTGRNAVMPIAANCSPAASSLLEVSAKMSCWIRKSGSFCEACITTVVYPFDHIGSRVKTFDSMVRPGVMQRLDHQILLV